VLLKKVKRLEVYFHYDIFAKFVLMIVSRCVVLPECWRIMFCTAVFAYHGAPGLVEPPFSKLWQSLC